LEPLEPTADAEPTELAQVARRYASAIAARQPEGPYIIGGWSFGGLVAFETARALRLARREVALVVLLDTNLEPVRPEPSDQAALFELFVRHLVGVARRPVPNVIARDGEDVSAWLDAARGAGLTPADVDQAGLAMHFEIFKRNWALQNDYVPSPLD